jgi:hypothetical protein
MSNDHNARQDEAAVRADTERLKQELLALGAIDIGMSEHLSPEQENQFLRRVLAFENGATTTLLAELQRIGIEVPAPATLSDATLTDKLWEVINGLARLRVFLQQTDHLSDRALYELLHDRLLPEEMDELGTDDGGAWHINILGGGSLEDIALHLKHYADEEFRRSWQAEWPDDDMPAHEDPPHDRDRLLPAPRW